MHLLVIFLMIYDSDATAQEYMERARGALDEGKYTEALLFYDKGIIENPDNYLLYYLRGYLHELLGKLSQSINDLTKCIQLNPNFHKARVNRAQLNIKQCQYDEALIDLNFIIKSDNKEFKDQSKLVSVTETKKHMKDFGYYYKKNYFDDAINASDKIVDVSPFCVSHRILRAELLEKKNRQVEFENELKLVPNNLEIVLQLSSMMFQRGDINECSGFGIIYNRYLRQCLQRDPDHTACRTLYKKVKNVKKLEDKIAANLEGPDYQAALKAAQDLMDAGDSPHYKFMAHVHMCRLYHQLNDDSKSLSHCASALKSDSGHIDTLLVRAKIYMSREQYDEAKEDYNAILSQNSHHREAKEALNKIENILKNKNRPNYYDILNVSKSATTKEIERAYRKLVKVWHPDHFRTDEERKVADKKMQELNAARQVLVNSEMRQRFDDGFDPLDPQDQHGGGGGGGGYQGDSGSFFNFFRGGDPFEGHGGQHFRFTFG